jgi:hypothetical protein
MVYQLPISTDKNGKFISFSSGQTLLEITIALAMGIMLVVGFVSAMNVGLASSTYASEKTKAIQYAEEGIEKLKNYRDEQGWSVISPRLVSCNPSGTVCDDTGGATAAKFFNPCKYNNLSYYTCDSSWPYNYQNDPPPPFERTYQATQLAPDKFVVKVTVSWPTRSGPSTVELFTVLTDWKYGTN